LDAKRGHARSPADDRCFVSREFCPGLPGPRCAPGDFLYRLSALTAPAASQVHQAQWRERRPLRNAFHAASCLRLARRQFPFFPMFAKSIRSVVARMAPALPLVRFVAVSLNRPDTLVTEVEPVVNALLSVKRPADGQPTMQLIFSVWVRRHLTTTFRGLGQAACPPRRASG
jgi:hypothetical protein